MVSQKHYGRIKPYLDLRENIQMLDVIAFSGKGRMSEIIKWKTKSEISHVGIVYKVFPQAGNGSRVMLIESTTLGNLPDIKTGELRKGVQLQFLSQRLASYDGEAWLYPLRTIVSDANLARTQDWLTSAHTQKIEYDSFQAIGAGLDFFDRLLGIENKEDLSSLFCSELVTKAFQIAGLVDKSVNPSEMTPKDVCDFRFLGVPTPLIA